MKRYFLDKDKSPTHFNLSLFLEEAGWKATKYSFISRVNDSWFEFPNTLSETLEFKHKFNQFLIDNQLSHLLPESFYIDDDNWSNVLRKIKTSSSTESNWILKPSLLNNGSHIHIFNCLKDFESHFLFSKRIGGPQVLQRYISEPKLIQGPKAGHKFSIRQLLVISNHAGVGLFPNGYLNIALKPYQQNNLSDLNSHLTNEHLEGKRVNVIQRLSEEMTIYQNYKLNIIEHCKLLMGCFKKEFQAFFKEKKPRLGIFGIDFMVDSKDRLWLLEANHGPCFPINANHQLFEKLYRPFWQEFIKQFINEKQSHFILI